MLKPFVKVTLCCHTFCKWLSEKLLAFRSSARFKTVCIISSMTSHCNKLANKLKSKDLNEILGKKIDRETAYLNELVSWGNIGGGQQTKSFLSLRRLRCASSDFDFSSFV